ncbi:MAG TPA: valine--tRNA ligase [Candidatus Omnitrophota bacterium]|nr:valine--tRNA ligase [Candidatus Omnitrophota bacterium]
MSEELAKAYDPSNVEQKWYKFWEENGLFKPDPEAKVPFSIVIPPPNITGSLHMGHALNNSIQDLLIRFKRMQGFRALWVPGTDHAGIATQNVVERELKKEGIRKEDLGREKFVERVWEWKKEYGGRITMQLRRLGSSCDWSRERFTMDEGLSRAVRRHFVQLYDEGLIYRGKRIINWCPRCQTALSDIEVEHETTKGHLWHIKYGPLTVATTRPETMLGDTAVAVNPKDERYKHVWGKTLELPLVGRHIPVIKDDFVDKSFGTGAVKVTPAHDPNDYDMGIRHNLPFINILTPDGRVTFNDMTDEEKARLKEFGIEGLDRFKAREKIVELLEKKGHLEKIEDYENSIGHCYRCKTVIEPYLSDQWFVKVDSLARAAVQSVEEGKIKFVPERWHKVYLQWMTNLRDWCISRQLWWGHQVPAWYCECGEIIVAEETPTKCPKCGSSKLTQDPDVFDTWFSSALWPFSTLGWPDDTEDLRTFYPTDVLVTSYDIIFFWVARMIMAGLHFLNKEPFHTVYFNALVKDIHGKKMSKSWGNVIDPLEVINKAGADALRFAFLSLIAGQGQDVKISEEKITEARNFANKLWNVSRFVMMTGGGASAERNGLKPLELADRWIASRLQRTVKKLTSNIDNFEIGDAARNLYDFIWSEFCDWYVELAKIRLYGTDEKEKKNVQSTITALLETILKVLHPFMPFETEEIYQILNGRSAPTPKESIMVQKWPEANDKLIDEKAEKEMDEVIGLIRAIRNVRATLGVPPGTQVKIICGKNLNHERSAYVKALAKVSEIVSGDFPPHTVVTDTGEIKWGMTVEGLIDMAAVKARLTKDYEKLLSEIEKVRGRLGDMNFLKNATEGSIEKEKVKLEEYLKSVKVLEGYLGALG